MDNETSRSQNCRAALAAIERTLAARQGTQI